MRARLLRPGFFSNDELAELPFETRILFAGLWCLADREGRLKDQPKRIRAAVFPFDDIDVDPLLDGLAGKKFITRYQIEGVSYIQVNNFLEHQKPHSRETPSKIPQVSPHYISEQGTTLDVPKHDLGSAQPQPRRPVTETVTETVTGNGTNGNGTSIAPTVRPDALVVIWNEIASASGLPLCRALGTADRLKNATDRWREKPDPAYWKSVAHRIAASPFCRGSGGKGWRATFDFFIEPDTHVKVLEGAYDHGPAGSAKTAGNAEALTRFATRRMEVPT